MQDLEFTVFAREPEANESLQALIGLAAQRKNVNVHLDLQPWSGGWPRMVSVALYRSGPDISEIGSTWIGDFVRMDALQPFTPQEIQRLGGGDKFLPSCWDVAVSPQKDGPAGVPWSIPWSADTRCICYRRDLLRKAGVDEAQAFGDAEQLDETLRRLKKAGVEAPLSLPTLRSRLTIHFVASWLWKAGGDFVEKGFREVSFDRPEALQAMGQYFSLGQYLPENNRFIDEPTANNLFLQGQAALVFGGHWILQAAQAIPSLKANLGVAPMPGVPFVGGTHLVVWKHSAKKSQVMQVIEFLVRDDAALSIFPGFGLPSWLSGLEKHPLAADPNYQVLSRMLKTGRAFPSGQLWGLVENRLVDSFPLIWKEVLSQENPDIDTILHNYLDPVARRLNLTMQG
ncbi:MAG: extracellular solute-binding protein [Anaerolineales bacterium]|nr:extracellular solute-binding protein [Anaerolineales bacterium]